MGWKPPRLRFMDISAIAPVALAAIGAWFWPHCARPSLVASGARPLALKLVLAVSVVYVAANVGVVVSQMTEVWEQAAWSLGQAASVAWILVVGVGYWTEFKLVIRLTGGADHVSALRFLLWQLGYSLNRVASDDPDPTWERRARQAVAALANHRTADTSLLIDLWIAETERLLDGIDAREPVEQRHSAIRSESQRLWPTAESSNIAARQGT